MPAPLSAGLQIRRRPRAPDVVCNGRLRMIAEGISLDFDPKGLESSQCITRLLSGARGKAKPPRTLLPAPLQAAPHPSPVHRTPHP